MGDYTAPRERCVAALASAEKLLSENAARIEAMNHKLRIVEVVADLDIALRCVVEAVHALQSAVATTELGARPAPGWVWLPLRGGAINLATVAHVEFNDDGAHVYFNHAETPYSSDVDGQLDTAWIAVTAPEDIAALCAALGLPGGAA